MAKLSRNAKAAAEVVRLRKIITRLRAEVRELKRAAAAADET